MLTKCFVDRVRPRLRGDKPARRAAEQRAHALEVSRRGNDDARGADDGLDDDRRDRGGALELDHVLQVLQRALALLLLRRGPELRAVQIGRAHV